MTQPNYYTVKDIVDDDEELDKFADALAEELAVQIDEEDVEEED